jgi:type I restriction enzyme S subunit
MSHYKPYPAYRDSGVEWIGQVPQDWQVKPLKIAVSHNDDVVPEAEYASTPIRYVDISAVSHDEGIGSTEAMLFGDAPSRARRKAKSGDVIISTVRTYLKAVAAVDEDHADCVFSTGFAVLRAREGQVDPSFLKWLALNELFIQAVESHSEGLSYPAINASELVNLKATVPSLQEQPVIASVLDRETTRIGALIAKKTRFIELLKEKRHAMIARAVTKGLVSDVPMRNSGVEWLGDIPTHWLVAQLGKLSIARCDGPFGSGLKSEHYQPEGVRVIRLQNIGWASFKDGNEAFISREHWQDVLGCGHEVLPNDVLIGGLGDDKNPLGRACVAPPNLGSAMVKADCYRFRLNTSRAVPEFIALALSATARSECGYLATGATRDRLNLGLASARVVPLPPRVEQAAIVASLNRDTARIDLLSEKTQRSIDLLKERRAALISAAVTGQIDLRESV